MWNQLGLFGGPENPFSVSEITGRIRSLLEQDAVLQSVWVAGEVSNFSRPVSGHVYFTLKDAGAQLACVIWRTQAQALFLLPRAGDQIVAHGHLGVYEAGGRYQLYVDFLQPAGQGSLYQEYERLKARLEAEGLSVRLVNVRMPKPIDVEAVLSAARETSLLVTVEDHFLTGGLFSIVSETLVRHGQTADVLPIALEERWFKPALLPDVLRHEGFTGEQLTARILERLPVHA